MIEPGAISECFRNSSISFTSKLPAEQTRTIPNKADRDRMPTERISLLLRAPVGRGAPAGATAGLPFEPRGPAWLLLRGGGRMETKWKHSETNCNSCRPFLRAGNRLQHFATPRARPARRPSGGTAAPRPPLRCATAHRRPRRSIQLRRAMGSRGGSRPLAGRAPGAGFGWE